VRLTSLFCHRECVSKEWKWDNCFIFACGWSFRVFVDKTIEWIVREVVQVWEEFLGNSGNFLEFSQLL
jgi:hypothetical protein